MVRAPTCTKTSESADLQLDPLILKAISIGLGLMFVVAAWHKLADAAGFRVTLLEYQVMPEAFVAPASRVIPVAELALGAAWLLGQYAGGLTAIASAALLAIYAGAIGVNLARGRVHFDCGCGFGGQDDSEQYLSGGLIVRNLALIGAALLALVPAAERQLGPGDWLALLGSLIAGTLLFSAANQLLANRAAINMWRKPK
mgnify:FL=1